MAKSPPVGYPVSPLTPVFAAEVHDLYGHRETKSSACNCRNIIIALIALAAFAVLIVGILGIKEIINIGEMGAAGSQIASKVAVGFGAGILGVLILNAIKDCYMNRKYPEIDGALDAFNSNDGYYTPISNEDD